jgi:hypothetical protein
MARVLRSGLSILAAIATCASLATACSDDDTEERRAAAQAACKKYFDPCTNCTCKVCFCSAECEDGFTTYTTCVDGCSEPGGEAQLRCFAACEAAAPASTRARLECAESAVSDECAGACKR